MAHWGALKMGTIRKVSEKERKEKRRQGRKSKGTERNQPIDWNGYEKIVRSEMNDFPLFLDCLFYFTQSFHFAAGLMILKIEIVVVKKWREREGE